MDCLICKHPDDALMPQWKDDLGHTWIASCWWTGQEQPRNVVACVAVVRIKTIVFLCKNLVCDKTADHNSSWGFEPQHLQNSPPPPLTINSDQSCVDGPQVVPRAFSHYHRDAHKNQRLTQGTFETTCSGNGRPNYTVMWRTVLNHNTLSCVQTNWLLLLINLSNMYK